MTMCNEVWSTLHNSEYCKWVVNTSILRAGIINTSKFPKFTHAHQGGLEYLWGLILWKNIELRLLLSISSVYRELVCADP